MFSFPAPQVAWGLASILEGGFYFKEFAGYTPLDTAQFVLGVAFVFLGVYILTFGHVHRHHFLQRGGSAVGSDAYTVLEENIDPTGLLQKQGSRNHSRDGFVTAEIDSQQEEGLQHTMSIRLSTLLPVWDEMDDLITTERTTERHTHRRTHLLPVLPIIPNEAMMCAHAPCIAQRAP